MQAAVLSSLLTVDMTSLLSTTRLGHPLSAVDDLRRSLQETTVIYKCGVLETPSGLWVDGACVGNTSSCLRDSEINCQLTRDTKHYVVCDSKSVIFPIIMNFITPYENYLSLAQTCLFGPLLGLFYLPANSLSMPFQSWHLICFIWVNSISIADDPCPFSLATIHSYRHFVDRHHADHLLIIGLRMPQYSL
jgi:hypothetical protein